MSSRELGSADVARLAELARLRPPDEDLAPLAKALMERAAVAAVLIESDLIVCSEQSTFDPRWHD